MEYKWKKRRSNTPEKKKYANTFEYFLNIF